MARVVDISKYTTKFTEYPEDFQAICDKNVIKLPGIDTEKGQAFALMAQPEVRGQLYLTRTETDKFFQQIGIHSEDSIQAFNKAMGLKRIPGRGKYCFIYPYEVEMTDLNKRIGGGLLGADKDTLVNAIKDWWRKNLVDVPNAEWQEGHLDPTLDTMEKNLAWQPPLQARYRNHFKWDNIFHRMWPTAAHLIEKDFTEYYTEAEQRALLAALKVKFEP